MKKFNSILAVAASAMIFAGCSDDKDFALNTGEGSVIISASYNSDVTVASRASLEDELSESTIIWISSTKGLVRKFEGFNSLPAEGIKLVAGEYIAEAWAGDSVSASFDKRYFKGVQPFTITNGTTRVELVCKIANVLASVDYDDAIDEVLTDYTLTVGHRRGSLTFEGRDDRKGYFMMPTGVTSLEYTLTGKQIDGSSFTRTGVIEDVVPATEYRLKVIYNPAGEELGGGFLTIEIDESEVVVDEPILITSAPVITGYGFDITKPIYAEPGRVGKRSIYVTAAAALTGMEIESEALTAVIGHSRIDLFKADASIVEELSAAGITYNYVYDEERDISNLKLSLWPEFTQTLKGETLFSFSAVDANGKSAVAQMSIITTDASVSAEELPADAPTTWPTKARLYGSLLKDDVTNPAIEYRAKGDSEWIHVPAVMVSRAGGDFYVDLTGLTPGTTYEYRSVCDGFVSTQVLQFTTQAALQLANAGFEEWSTSSRGKNPVIPAPSDNALFWDSGNHGSATMGKNITDKSTDYVHEGTYSAKLVSQFVGMMGIGKFAAGNIFVGQYLYTDGTDGELGWGRPFNSRPTSVKLWARYEPGTVQSGNNKGSGSYMNVGDKDQGIIYLALVDDTKTTYTQSKSDCNNTAWPCIVKTKSAQLFNPEGDNVIGYAVYVFDKATDGSGLVEINMDITYYREDVVPSNIIFVASASRYGDYFQGGEGSTLYLDDIQMIY